MTQESATELLRDLRAQHHALKEKITHLGTRLGEVAQKISDPRSK
jgi:hypothetical protein